MVCVRFEPALLHSSSLSPYSLPCHLCRAATDDQWHCSDNHLSHWESDVTRITFRGRSPQRLNPAKHSKHRVLWPTCGRLRLCDEKSSQCVWAGMHVLVDEVRPQDAQLCDNMFAFCANLITRTIGQHAKIRGHNSCSNPEGLTPKNTTEKH